MTIPKITWIHKVIINGNSRNDTEYTKSAIINDRMTDGRISRNISPYLYPNILLFGNMLITTENILNINAPYAIAITPNGREINKQIKPKHRFMISSRSNVSVLPTALIAAKFAEEIGCMD